jgi:hypothetical protein
MTATLSLYDNCSKHKLSLNCVENIFYGKSSSDSDVDLYVIVVKLLDYIFSVW